MGLTQKQASTLRVVQIGHFGNPDTHTDYQRVTIVQDDDGHTYIIPFELYSDFSVWMEMEPYYPDNETLENTRQKLDTLFSTYRSGGDITDSVPLYAKVGYEKDL